MGVLRILLLRLLLVLMSTQSRSCSSKRVLSSLDAFKARFLWQNGNPKISTSPYIPRNGTSLNLSCHSCGRVTFRPSRSSSKGSSIQFNHSVPFCEQRPIILREEKQHIQCVLCQTGLGLGH